MNKTDQKRDSERALSKNRDSETAWSKNRDFKKAS